MTNPTIQNQIRLIDFKATKIEFNVTALPKGTKPQQGFRLDLRDTHIPGNQYVFAKTFIVDLEGPADEHDDGKLNLHIEFSAMFECPTPIAADFLQTDFVRIAAPAIGFPFVRALISTISVQAGFPAIILPAINFVQFDKDHEGHKEAAPKLGGN